MTDSIDKTEHYLKFTTTASKLDLEHMQGLLHKAQHELDQTEWIYFIFDISQASQIDADTILSLQDINDGLLAKNGLLICVHESSEMMAMFEENQLLLLPTESEAIEYIYMDQLEKQFLEDSE
jgi:hypothetical protein